MSLFIGNTKRGMTLLELTASIVVLSIVAGMLAPIAGVTTQIFSSSAGSQGVIASTELAIDRVSGLVRDAAPAEGGVGITVAQPARMELSTGEAVWAAGGDLWLRDAEGSDALLAEGLTAFELVFIGADGVTATEGSPADTRRVEVLVGIDGFSLRTVAFPRAAIGGGS